ncbi:hypothetical protein IMZ31_08445 [Pontibacillus sp. ALD_SL1]|uniref:hypothetical protein n=1 Tax=Pontibacillus sp. ALD_SL1 TaxID=2777185 RepID=UPI001A96F386|nr:hypothetical protein [Pontibacillus sp. ALD_SL1]QST01569.1 hypothetical protein IMZ31_08445 [Pontibacillus sp. ALD_SL1]
MSSLTTPQLLNQLRSSAALNQQSQSLQQGSLVGGKVLKLYPQARALIQIGGSQMNAQLEASLSVNERYVFQVQQTKPMLRLRVIEEENGKTLQSSPQVLQQLGISSPSKSQMNFVSELIQKNIPFTRQDLKEALQIIEQSGSRSRASQVLLDMFSRNLPIKSSVFHALYTRYTDPSSLTASLQSALNGVENVANQSQASLGHQLQQTLGRGGSSLPLDQAIMRTLMNAPIGEQKNALQLLKRSGHVSNQMSLSQLQDQLPINDSDKLKNQLARLLEQQLPVSKGTKSVIHQFSSILNKLTDKQGNVAEHMPPKLEQALNQLTESLKGSGVWSSLKVALTNQGASQQSLKALEYLIGSSNPTKVLNENRSSLKEVTNTLNQVMNQQLSKGESVKLIEWLRHGLQEPNEMAMSMKDQFLVKLKAYTQLSGINYEYQLAEKGEAPSLSLKGSILQAMQDPLSPIVERLQRVLNHLNAAPIMMQESEQSIQFNVQMPGEWFGIEQDVTMDVEGNKKENGEIDPDYCHILFYLDLHSLKETVIDMRIQQRIVQLTLFTEKSGVEGLIQVLKPSLEKGLEQLNYKLSTVRHKEINLKDSSETATNKTNTPTRNTGGFDQTI